MLQPLAGNHPTIKQQIYAGWQTLSIGQTGHTYTHEHTRTHTNTHARTQLLNLSLSDFLARSYKTTNAVK